jgi:hypothetical protein
MLQGVAASGGTLHAAAVNALANAGTKIPRGAKLVVIVVGDEAGETGQRFADSFTAAGFGVSALALILNVAYSRGRTVQDAAAHLGVPFSTITVEQFDDPYQVPRIFKTILEAPVPTGPDTRQSNWVEKVMSTPLLELQS